LRCNCETRFNYVNLTMDSNIVSLLQLYNWYFYKIGILYWYINLSIYRYIYINLSVAIALDLCYSDSIVVIGYHDGTIWESHTCPYSHIMRVLPSEQCSASRTRRGVLEYLLWTTHTSGCTYPLHHRGVIFVCCHTIVLDSIVFIVMHDRNLYIVLDLARWRCWSIYMFGLIPKPLYVCAIYLVIGEGLYITSLVEFRIKKYG